MVSHPMATKLQSICRNLSTRLLLVEPDEYLIWTLRRAFEACARTEVCTTFQAARTRLALAPVDFLVTNVRLRAYNGLHLVHLVTPPTRAIVYMDPPDAVLFRDAQQAHAFIESPERLGVAIAAYIQGSLPDFDRRSVSLADRRSTPRGGRRSADVRTIV